MAIVVDASVALKWVLDEDGAEAARALLQSDDLIAPDFLLLECSNVLTLLARRGKISDKAASAFIDVIEKAPVRFVSFRSYLGMARTLATAHAQTVYDCLYMAVTMDEDATLVTADARFAAAFKEGPWEIRVLTGG